MAEIAGVNIAPDASTTLQRMINLNLTAKLDELEVVSSGATKEYSLEKAMDRMQVEWEPLEFNVVPYRDTDLNIMASVEEIQVAWQEAVFSVRLLITTV
jgi:dynein heavy chain